MTLYHFDVRYDEDEWSIDLDGLDLAYPVDARREAVKTAAELAKDAIGWHRRISVRVRDSYPESLLTINIVVTEEWRGLGIGRHRREYLRQSGTVRSK